MTIEDEICPDWELVNHHARVLAYLTGKPEPHRARWRSDYHQTLMWLNEATRNERRLPGAERTTERWPTTVDYETWAENALRADRMSVRDMLPSDLSIGTRSMGDANEAVRWRFMRNRLFFAPDETGTTRLMVKDAKSRPPAEVAEPYGTVLDPGHVDLSVDLWIMRTEGGTE